MNLNDFITEALKGNGVMNDSENVWVEVDGTQYAVEIDCVLDHEETEPFEASSCLEDDLQNSAWEELYEQYLAGCDEE